MNREPGWDLYRSFLAVLETGSLSAAARELGLTQPTLARHIDALEQAVGADLFLRSPHGLLPTELARELQPHARMLASTAATLLRTASGPAREVRGTVRISASEVVGIEHLPPLLTDLRRRHPGLVIELTLSDAIDNLLLRQADIAVRHAEPAQDALVARHLPSLELGLYAHQDYLDRHGMPASLAELADHALIGFDRETPALRTALQQFPWLPWEGFALRADSNLAQLAAIRAAFGIGLCQAVFARRDPRLVRVLAADFTMDLNLWVVMHEDLKTSARCRTVFDALAEGLSAIR